MEASFSKLSLEENDTKLSAEKDKIRHNVWGLPKPPTVTYSTYM